MPFLESRYYQIDDHAIEQPPARPRPPASHYPIQTEADERL